ncbi:sugar diacid utilization regulator [Desulfosporosinus orientis DSM 765]|uniref:Sugar diacid utilization regulator n=1 Tax=Desulfosporosinus orientis (strain ATCC 19365 / DSM 765 / NCIMB 8382 / VKM B-1628 / Singapore I) TaxID=768706 RepID=G7W6K9_DESOD|nr:helix-turn-helix domain-containing protein [Desulfosporosinus orientis]AET68647.1 sugar diacid utilization regulator [Desulfosporosinus orientis DSM 765]
MSNINKDFSISHTLRELLKASGLGLDALTCTLGELLNVPILIATPSYETLSTTFLHPDLDSFHVEINGPKGNEKLFLCTIATKSLRIKAAGWAIAPNGRVIGYVFLLFDKDDPDFEAYQSLMESATSLYATHLQNQLELKQEKHKTKNAFFYDLLYGNLKRNEEIIQMGRVWGWDLRKPQAVLTMVICELEHYSPDWHLMDILQRTVDRVIIDKYFRNPATTVNRNEFIVLIPFKTEKDSEQNLEISSLMKDILVKIENTELAHRVCCGVGQTYKEAINLFRSYQEAKVALDMGKLLGIEIPFFSDLGLERILYKHDLQDLKEYHDHVLGKLSNSEEMEDGLLETLETFTMNQFDVNKTAQELFIHRNTLRNRLNKIETILGCYLDDMDTRLNMSAAFTIRRLHKF